MATRLIRAFAFASLLLLAFSAMAQSQTQAIVSGFNANTLPRNDDGSTGPVPMGFSINLFGVTVDRLHVNNNGNVTFGAALSAFTPFPLLATDQLIVAPFFADVDTSVAGDPVTYGVGTFEGRPAFGANWINVDYFPSSSTHSNRNSFQLILVSRADRRSGDFDIVFNYGQIRWEAGTASGSDVNGRGGSSARAGFAIGRGAPGSAVELIGSASNGAFIDGNALALISNRRGSTVNGRYVYEIRGSDAAAQVGALTPFANAPSQAAVASGNGRFVVFQTMATNLVSGSPSGVSQILRVDTQTGAVTRISVDNGGTAINGNATEPTISNDGNFVVFVAPAAVPQSLLGESRKAREERMKTSGSALMLRNLLTGSTQMVAPAATAGAGTAPQISANGNALVLTRETTNAAQGQVGQRNIYLVPLIRNGNAVTAGPERCVTCKSVAANGSDTTTNSNGVAGKPSISADGTWVAFETTAKNVLASTPAACPNSGTNMNLRNMLTGVVLPVSAPAAGGNCGAAGGNSAGGDIDLSGLRLAFETDLPLVPGDANTTRDVYVFDVTQKTVERVSQTAAGASGNGASTQATMSGDGRFVGFVTAATNLDPTSADTNGVADLVVVEVEEKRVSRLATTDSGQQADGSANRPSFNFDGSRLSFDSAAGNLAAGAVAGQLGVYQRANPLSIPNPELLSATWWDPSESGWGLFTADQGNVLATGWFTYDSDGEPTWFLLTPSGRGADGSYVGSIERYTGVPFDRTPGNAAETSAILGQGSVRFSGTEQLSLTYTVNGTTQTKSLSRFPFAASELRCTASPTPSRATATNFSDLWWGGATGSVGWGLHMSHIDNNLFATWYTYDSDREPVFFVAVTSRQPNGTFTGSLFRQPNG
ncbi:MAG: nidogen-like domain-containing protein, partial [Pseudomarimonas sp.]